MMDLATIATEMTRLHVIRVRLENGVEVELHPSAFGRVTSVVEEPSAEQEADSMCKCGHDLETLHNEAGCLRGCALLDCVPEPQEEP